MRSSFEVSLGVITPDGVWMGIRAIRNVHISVTDRNVGVALDGLSTKGGSLVQDERPSDAATAMPTHPEKPDKIVPITSKFECVRCAMRRLSIAVRNYSTPFWRRLIVGAR
jgi:hypothetical protein